jgi:hypothetical protein
MPKFEVDEDVARLVERLANPKPFENLSFNAALKRVLDRFMGDSHRPQVDLNELLAESMAAAQAQPKKAPSPSAQEWAATVPELKNKRGLTTWRAICDHLKIQTGGDSARRRLQTWVKLHKPAWPPVPDTPTTAE